MKKAAAAIFFVLVLVFASTAGAMSDRENSVWVKVPFSFYAGKTLIPAGTYQFSMKLKPFEAGHVLRIINRDGTFCQHVYTNRIEGNATAKEVQLFFNKYGESYFLSKVQGRSMGAELNKSSTEKQIEKLSGEAQGVVGSTVRPKTRSAK